MINGNDSHKKYKVILIIILFACRYNLKFRKQTPEEIEKRKALHYAPIKLLGEEELELETEFFFPPGLDYPMRPEWKKNMSKQELDRNENKHFRLFCEKLDKDFADKDLSLYELNLETWRQLWRVTEMSDILLIIVDARFPVSNFIFFFTSHQYVIIIFKYETDPYNFIKLI